MNHTAENGLTIGSTSSAAPARGSAWITDHLRHAIRTGRYAHGEKLPAEREFASSFGASRATIRTALIRLEVERLVTRRVGAGTFVNFRSHGSSEDIAELTSPLELIEVRLGIEPQILRLAVLNATGRDVERLGSAIAAMEESSATTDTFTLWDRQFHELIAEATRNPLMVWIYRQINDVRTHTQWSAMKDKVLTPQRIAEYNQQHVALYEAIRARDLEGAVALITNHLQYARRQLMGASAGEGEAERHDLRA